MSPILIGTDLSKRDGVSHSGFVDVVHSRLGVRGWAVNLADPLEPVRLQLYVGEHVVAETVAERDRADISAKLGRPVRAGFAFDPDIMAALPSFMAEPDDLVTVRVAGGGQLPSSTGQATTIGDIIAQLRLDATPEPRSTAADFDLMLDQVRTNHGSD